MTRVRGGGRTGFRLPHPLPLTTTAGERRRSAPRPRRGLRRSPRLGHPRLVHAGVDPARALDSLTSGRSTITIAHRLSTAEASDLVVVVDQGHVVEVGPHEELAAAGGVYARMHQAWVAQTR